MPSDGVGCCEIILAIFIPPVAVFMHRGCGADLLINLCLLCLAWLPGVIHAFYVLLH
ncbi:putative plasma membrane proteolipid 3 [Aspergillus steynii IBT 23096]|uniref:Putative plasma membrane proteolipid 3 n=1 Tax=Aspergillus steynii IBT 23096 TaxID=1392250 RepID=A0A2I2GLK7_9EURO|nr:putative plasma membrane proteolipid 3 [Aspergillus steynii IBT 23096]PLB53755.1 putative plasma membrane proteolipid 3 [Aspergillus steynii IBT 23096]